MSKMDWPYVGITGFRTQEEVVRCLGSLDVTNLFTRHRRLIMVGAMAGPCSFLPPDKRVDLSFASPEELAAVFSGYPPALNTLHYYQDPDTSDSEFEEVLFELVEPLAETGLAGILHAVQFDLSWPNPEILKKLRERHPYIRIIVQLGGRHSEDVLTAPKELNRWANTYRALVHNPLVDLSAGRGELVDVGVVLNAFWTLSRDWDRDQLAFAGGLSSGTLSEVKEILRGYPKSSFDAQTGVTTDYRFDDKKSDAFLRAAYEVLEEVTLLGARTP